MAGSWASDFEPCVIDFAGWMRDLLGHLQCPVAKMAAGHGRGSRGGQWEGRFGHHKNRQWAGGFGPWGRWWPGPGGPGGPNFGPGAPQRHKAGRGDVRAAILALLREGPRNGYQIMCDIDERSGGSWRPSPGAIYPALQQLADEDLIAAEESGGRRTFSLTGEGRAYVGENPEMARGAWESRSQQESWELPGLFAQAARLGAGIVQMAHAGTPEQVHAAEQLLEQTQRRLYQILADVADQDERDDHDDQDDQ